MISNIFSKLTRTIFGLLILFCFCKTLIASHETKYVYEIQSLLCDDFDKSSDKFTLNEKGDWKLGKWLLNSKCLLHHLKSSCQYLYGIEQVFPYKTSDGKLILENPFYPPQLVNVTPCSVAFEKLIDNILSLLLYQSKDELEKLGYYLTGNKNELPYISYYENSERKFLGTQLEERRAAAIEVFFKTKAFDDLVAHIFNHGHFGCFPDKDAMKYKNKYIIFQNKSKFKKNINGIKMKDYRDYEYKFIDENGSFFYKDPFSAKCERVSETDDYRTITQNIFRYCFDKNNVTDFSLESKMLSVVLDIFLRNDIGIDQKIQTNKLRIILQIPISKSICYISTMFPKNTDSPKSTYNLEVQKLFDSDKKNEFSDFFNLHKNSTKEDMDKAFLKEVNNELISEIKKEEEKKETFDVANFEKIKKRVSSSQFDKYFQEILNLEDELTKTKTGYTMTQKPLEYSKLNLESYDSYLVLKDHLKKINSIKEKEDMFIYNKNQLGKMLINQRKNKNIFEYLNTHVKKLESELDKIYKFKNRSNASLKELFIPKDVFVKKDEYGNLEEDIKIERFDGNTITIFKQGVKLPAEVTKEFSGFAWEIKICQGEYPVYAMNEEIAKYKFSGYAEVDKDEQHVEYIFKLDENGKLTLDVIDYNLDEDEGEWVDVVQTYPIRMAID